MEHQYGNPFHSRIALGRFIEWISNVWVFAKLVERANFAGPDPQILEPGTLSFFGQSAETHSAAPARSSRRPRTVVVDSILMMWLIWLRQFSLSQALTVSKPKCIST